MITISDRETIFRLVQEHPQLQAILASVGFTEIVKPGMLATVGRFMNLRQGSSLRKIDFQTLPDRLRENGFELKEDSHE